MKTTIAIIDIIGTPYDGSTLEKRGLGGSESAVILMARELANLDFDVRVFNNCIDDASEGIYSGVTYRHISKVNECSADVMISSRTVIPYVPAHHAAYTPASAPFENLIKTAKLKILWMHDTFCQGDDILEELVVNGHIDELFTLSDFHTAYVTNCNHGRRRNFEVLKNKIFMTRNGINRYLDEVDILKKDRNLFVYNASVTKGMIPLVENVWPLVKQRLPNARLKVIGGFYKFKDGIPDVQELKWRTMANDPGHAKRDVEFTGIIRQDEIANILAEASFMIYPAVFPETSGISTLESLSYNTPLITCRFGALEETAFSQACYLIDYAVEPNVLFTDINKDRQVALFANTVVDAYNNTYLHQQKMYACNAIRDISGWATVALQWKQHILSRIGEFMPVEEYRKVIKVNEEVHRVYGRRFSNKEEWAHHKTFPQNHIAIITPFFNAAAYLEKCVLSVAQQDYDNYKHYIINDASTDNSRQVLEEIVKKLPKDRQEKIGIINNDTNNGAVFNQVSLIKHLQKDDIVMMLDGDDWLVNDGSIFQMYNNIYNDGYEFTYGSCWSVVDRIPLIAQPYPKDVLKSRSYRNHKFNWNMPYTHLRTFKKHLIDNVNDRAFKDADDHWYKAGGDGSIFYSLIEQVDPSKIKVVQEIVYNYNDASPLNDYKVNGAEQTKNATQILQGPKVKKRILLAIPTAKYIECETFKSIYDLIVPDDYEIDFQFFYGYNVDQVRNLIAHWAQHYDYLFSVDSDIVLPKDSLVKLLSHNKDVVSGLYIQRKPGQHILEIYVPTGNGGTTNVPYETIKNKPLVEVAGCGFGCVLVKSEVIRKIGYPQFVYKSAIDHKDTVSEDVYFCARATAHGFKIFADTTIHCDHVGSTKFKV